MHGLGLAVKEELLLKNTEDTGIHIQNSGAGTLYANYLIATENNAWANNWGSIIYTNKWYHIVMTYDGNLSSDQLKGYLNGSMDGQWSKTGNILSNLVMVLVGQWNAVITTGYFDGAIDDVRIYNYNLTSSQIKQNYIAGLDFLLSKGLVSEGEYDQRLNELAVK